MDILTHTLSGVAVGTVVSSFEKRGWTYKLKIILLSGFAGALPDLDAISLWRGFDSTIGVFFNLEQSGRVIYSAKYWYSHHAFLHSLTAGVMLMTFVGLISYFFNTKVREVKYKNLFSSFNQMRLSLIGFLFGFMIHLLEDMPTPSSSWGGVNLFWPSKMYIGGTGHIWWWNNYDIFLIVVSVIVINLLLHLLQNVVKFDLKSLTVIVFMIGFASSIYQMNTRGFDFAYTGSTNKYHQYEAKSKEIQKEILGDKVYKMMESFDNKLRFYF
ncbi:metal-dependent hydrolase [Flammeovirga aprica]|uniref:Metal-dependent hydrolase n=1 Tax=Flammeovirga aprica JL-4 TaxID=694437 RepID=A0A7X9RZQ9_9BACT|nr:metal-dependent hydrolase [Flammeovirga aprica]NME71745.1 metal-dependent hydrolase [Flammeovirga aprica JL-4]